MITIYAIHIYVYLIMCLHGLVDELVATQLL